MATTQKSNVTALAPEPEETPKQKMFRLNSTYKEHAEAMNTIAAELFEYGVEPPAVKLITTAPKVAPNLVTPEIEKQVREQMTKLFPTGCNGGEFQKVLGLCGIAGVKEVKDARAELETRKVIAVEGGGRGRSGGLIIKLLPES